MSLQAGEVYAIGGIDLTKAFKALDDLMSRTTKSMGNVEKAVNASLAKIDKSIASTASKFGITLQQGMVREFQKGFSSTEKLWKNTANNMDSTTSSLVSRINQRLQTLKEKTAQNFKERWYLYSFWVEYQCYG